MSNELPEKTRKKATADEYYMNLAQIIVNLIDANITIVEMGRAGGKTEGVLGPRILRVVESLPGETSVLAHSSYVALLSIIVPNILTFFGDARGEDGKPLLIEGVHYVVGEKNLPPHFNKPRYPIQHHEHTIVFWNGHNIRLVSSERADSIAGANVVHAFIEEMKHNKGDKIKTRIFPALRVSRLSKSKDKSISNTHKSPYFQGITGISDTARVSLGENSWFYEFEQSVNKKLISEIVTTALHVNDLLQRKQNGESVSASNIAKWEEILRQQRMAATFYLRASTFVNKDVLGIRYFANMLKSMTIEEFLVAICAVRERKVANMFFASFDENKHTYSDGYMYDSLLTLNLKDTFKVTSGMLKFCKKDEKLLIGFDPGGFASCVVAQEKRRESELRILKELYVYSPDDLSDLARKFNDFFSDHPNKFIDLYYDRAGNQKKEQQQMHDTDAKKFKAALESHGWHVTLKNKYQRTIFHWEHFQLFQRLLAEQERKIPRIRIDENECPNLISSILVSPIKMTGGIIELDKSSERKLPFQQQAGLSTQIPSGLMYLVFSLYEKLRPGKDYNPSNLPVNMKI